VRRSGAEARSGDGTAEEYAGAADLLMEGSADSVNFPTGAAVQIREAHRAADQVWRGHRRSNPGRALAAVRRCPCRLV
jgi:hypothetical protein